MNRKIALIIGMLFLVGESSAVVIPAPAPGGAVNQYLTTKNKNTPKDNDANPNTVLYFFGTVALIVGLFGIGEIIFSN